MVYSVEVAGGPPDCEYARFAKRMRTTVHEMMASGDGTRDLCGADGLTTEAFVAELGRRLRNSDFAVGGTSRQINVVVDKSL